MPRQLSAIQADLDATYAMRSAAIANGGIYEYSKDSGQGSQSVKRMTLLDINKLIAVLEEEYADAEAALSGRNPDAISYSTRRW